MATACRALASSPSTAHGLKRAYVQAPPRITVPRAQLGRSTTRLQAAVLDAPASDAGIEASGPPTPVLPCERGMADFLLTFRSMLQNSTGSGDAIAGAGSAVLSRIRAGLLATLNQHDTGLDHDAKWRRQQNELERCLWELEKDLELIKRAGDESPSSLTRQIASLHCLEAARIIRTL